MNRPALAGALRLLLVVAAAMLATTQAPGGGTPDGRPPARETVCDGLRRGARGLCNAYCEAQDCDVHERPSCAVLRQQFERATGGQVFPCDPHCGDGEVNQVSEECDGTDAAACPGSCLADCTCPALCGDGSVNQPGEECDGADAAACPGLCRTDCTCPPAQSDCVCYFSSDCPTGSSCTYDGFDLCVFQIPKPDGVIGGGCTEPGGQVGGACDGLCVSSASGSACGTEDRSALSTAILLWGEATIQPAERGGGLVDQELARQANSIPTTIECSKALGRQVQGAILVAIAGVDLLIHPEAVHDSEDHGVADLSGNPCLVSALRLGVEALVAEYNTPGTGAPILDGIPGLCPGALDRVLACGEGIGALDCVKQRVVDTGLHLRTSPVSTPR